jgi:dipeptidyl aminopeptidase/acylaminoacyl peptidase
LSEKNEAVIERLFAMLKIGIFRLIQATAVLFLLGCSPAAETNLLTPTAIYVPVASQTPAPVPTVTLVPSPASERTLIPSPAPLLRIVPDGELPCTFSTSYTDLPPGYYVVYDTRNDGCYSGECQQYNVLSIDKKISWPLVRGVACSPDVHSFSADGHLMAFTDQTNGNFQLYMHDFASNITIEYGSSWGCSDPALSPNGSKIAASCFDKLRVISVADGTNLLPASVSISAALKPAWSPDGSKLAYLGYQEYMSGGISILNANSLLPAGGFRHNNNYFRRNFDLVWSPDGLGIGFIYLNQSGETEINELRVLGLDGKASKTYPLRVVPTLGELQWKMTWLQDGRFIFGKVNTIFVLSPDGTIRKLIDDASVFSGWFIPAR